MLYFKKLYLQGLLKTFTIMFIIIHHTQFNFQNIDRHST